MTSTPTRRSGQRHFTLHAMVGDKVLIVQPDAYDLVEFKVSVARGRRA